MNTRRKPAFDPARLDDLDDVLAVPVPPAPRLEQLPDPTVVDPATADCLGPEAPATAVEHPRQPRGSGGRPRKQPQAGSATGGPVAVAVRIPPMLYSDVNQDLLAGPERPSYGQLVIWACEDHPDSIIESVRSARPAPGSRRPRGHRLAAADVQITLRMTSAERDLLDELAAQVQPDDGKPVTRTEVAIAALTQALLHTTDV